MPFTVDEIIRLKEAGLTADEIAKLNAPEPEQQPNPDTEPETEPEEQPETPDVWDEVNSKLFKIPE